MLRLFVWPILIAAAAKPPRLKGAAIVLAMYRMARKALRRPGPGALFTEKYEIELISWHRAFAILGGVFCRGAIRALRVMLSLPLTAWKLRDLVIQERKRRETAIQVAGQLFPSKIGEAMRAAPLYSAFEYYVEHCLVFGPLLKHYDVIQGYSIDGIVPLANGHPIFASYEHGTLRDLPFEESINGLICRVSYTNSPAVFVTNPDVLVSVRRLGLDATRIHNLPHAFDDQRLRQWREAHSELGPPGKHVVCFCPTRQDWCDPNPSLNKGNDIMLRAAGRLWAEERRFQLVMVEWGRDVVETKKLIDQLGFSAAVRWVPPMSKQDLWRTYCTSHAVLDQFSLPGLSGVGFETLALGCRLIARTDQPMLADFFGAAPPVLPAATVNEVVSSLERVLDDPEDIEGLGSAGRDWIKIYHSAQRTVSIQAQVYLDMLAHHGRRSQHDQPTADSVACA